MYKVQIVKTEKAPKKPRKPLPRKVKVLIIFGTIALLVGLGYYQAHKTLTGPAIGMVITSVPTTQSKKEVELAQFDGKLISFVHPLTFVEQAQKTPPQNSLETHTFVSAELASQVLIATITSLPTRNLEDDASYKMRLEDKAKYHMKQTVVKNEKVVIFTTDDAQQVQQAAFWVHGDKLLTFVLSGGAPDRQAVVSQYNDMVSSITWH